VVLVKAVNFSLQFSNSCLCEQASGSWQQEELRVSLSKKFGKRIQRLGKKKKSPSVTSKLKLILASGVNFILKFRQTLFYLIYFYLRKENGMQEVRKMFQFLLAI